MKLTKREAEVRELRDLSTKEIAARLGIATNTVLYHRRNLDLKIARNRGEIGTDPTWPGNGGNG